MRTDYTSTQTLEFEVDENGYSVDIEIGLKCTVASFSGYFSPIDGGEPPHGPEFEVTTITVDVPPVNPYGKPGGSSLELTYEQLCALFSQEVTDKLLDAAENEAAEKGGF